MSWKEILAVGGIITESGSVSLRFQHQVVYVISNAAERSYRNLIVLNGFKGQLIPHNPQATGLSLLMDNGLSGGVCGCRNFSFKTQSTKSVEKQDRWLISPPIQPLKEGLQRCHLSQSPGPQLQGNVDVWGQNSRKITHSSKGTGKTLLALVGCGVIIQT